MPLRKHITEFAIISFAEKIAITQQKWLDEAHKLDFDPHIYMIARRPKITLDPNTFCLDMSTLKVDVIIHKENKAEVVKFETRNLLGTSAVRLECKYPYSEFEVFDKHTGHFLSRMIAANILTTGEPKYWDFLNLEVLYVGQSYGTKQSRNAIERLKKHETLQNIYSEAIRNFPDQDIWLLLFHFTPLDLISISNKDVENPSIQIDDEHTKINIHQGISEQQFINFTEAALIKYFQPDFNIKYKNTFPNPAHLTYKDCYDLDLNLVALEIQTRSAMCRLWSSTVEPKWTHKHIFHLHSTEERKSMFDLLV